MKRFHVKQYKVRHKCREYSVLVFPKVKHMWAMDCGEDGYCVDAPVDGFVLLKYAVAILIEAPDKIIYFPCRQPGIGRYYPRGCDFVLCTPKEQLRRSQWGQIRRQLKPCNEVLGYRLQYDRKKLDDYVEKFFYDKHDQRFGSLYLKTEICKEMDRERIEEIIGHTMFMVCGKTELYYNHYKMAKEMDDFMNGYKSGIPAGIGYILSDASIRAMYEEMEKDKMDDVKREKIWEEWRNGKKQEECCGV